MSPTSFHLLYSAILLFIFLAGNEGFEPPRALTPLPVFKTSPFSHLGNCPNWWTQLDSNQWQAGYEPVTLTRLSYASKIEIWIRFFFFFLVAPKRLELLTFRVWTERSSQLSYRAIMVERKGVEPSTSCVQNRRSSQMSYPPIMVKKTGFEPATTTSQT